MTRTSLAAFASLVLAAGALVPTARVRAQSARSEYQTTIDRALEEFEARRWEEARTLFQRAHELEPNARTFRAIGMVSFELRDYVSALVAFESALADERRPLSAAQRQEVERLLADSRTFVAAYELDVNPITATVSVDGLPAVIREGRLMLNPGSHDVRIVAEGFEESVVQVDSRGGHAGQIAVTLRLFGTPEPARDAPELETVPAGEPTTTGRAGRGLVIAGWSTLAAGVAIGGVSLGLGLKSHSIYEELEPICPCPDRADDIDRGEALGVASTATTFVAIGAAAAGGTMLVVGLLRDDSSDDGGATVDLTGGPGDVGAGLVVRF